MTFPFGRIALERVHSVGAVGGTGAAQDPTEAAPDLSTAVESTPTTSFAPAAAQGAPVARNPLAGGLSRGARGVRLNGQGREAHPSFVSSTVPASRWDSSTRFWADAMERLIRQGSTPAMEVQLREGNSRTTRSPKYSDQQDVAGQYVVSGLRDGKLKVRMFLPVSGHTGDQNGNGIPDHDEYAKTDKAVIWVAYIDRQSSKPGDPIDVPWALQSTPNPDDPASWPKAVKVLAKDIACPPGSLVRVVDVDVPMLPNKVAVLMFDGNSEGPGADPGGFVSGRLREYFWDAPASVAGASLRSTAVSPTPPPPRPAPQPQTPTPSTPSPGTGNAGGTTGAASPAAGSTAAASATNDAANGASPNANGPTVPRPGQSARLDFAAAPKLPARPSPWQKLVDTFKEVITVGGATTATYNAVDKSAWQAYGKAQAEALDPRTRQSYFARTDQELVGQLAGAIQRAQPGAATEHCRGAAEAMVAGLRAAD